MCRVHDRRAGASLIDSIQDGQGELQALWIAAKSTAQAMRDDAQELLDRLRSMRVRLDRAIAWLERECPPSLSLGCRGVVVIRLPPLVKKAL